MVKISGVETRSRAERCGVAAGDNLIAINGNEIFDVLDYRFYLAEKEVSLSLSREGENYTVTIKKGEYDDIGLLFETALMDEKHSCKNGCIFCFIDQNPKGMRDTIYFKDDDSRLSFLFGNYITLTNITEHEIERIIKMHISPINISVHTTNPSLRCEMMNNRFAGQSLEIIDRLNSAGIAVNCQLVLCPEYNDGEELRRSLSDLTAKENVRCIAAVPVGLTKHREGLTPLKSFDKETADNVLKIFDEFGEKCLKKYGERRVFASDEFYILAQRKMPEAEFYEDFLQLENGVGLSALLKSEVLSALEQAEPSKQKREVSIATGVLAYPLICELVQEISKKRQNLQCNVYKIENKFFGEKITVSGLVTGGDLISELKGKPLGEELLIPSSMLRYENDMFLDDVTVEKVEESLNIKIKPVNNDGFDFVLSVLGEEEF